MRRVLVHRRPPGRKSFRARRNTNTSQTVASGAAVSLDGSNSSDPDEDPLTYAWTQIGGSTVSLTGAETATPTFTAPGESATLEFQLEVCDTSQRVARTPLS